MESTPRCWCRDRHYASIVKKAPPLQSVKTHQECEPEHVVNIIVDTTYGAGRGRPQPMNQLSGKEPQKGRFAPQSLPRVDRVRRPPPPTVMLRDQPQVMSPSQPRWPPSRAVDAPRKAAATPGSSNRKHVEGATLRAPRPLPRPVRTPRRKASSFSPSEYVAPYEENPWRNSWQHTRHPRGPSLDDKRLGNEAIRGQDPPHRRKALPPTAAPPTVPPAETGGPSTLTIPWLLEIRGLPKTMTPERIYDTVSSFIAVDEVQICQVDNRIFGLITIADSCPTTWLCECVRRDLSFQEESLVVPSSASEHDTASTKVKPSVQPV